MEDKIQELADNLTSSIMSYVYGERFDNSDDITEDEELDKAWEYINERCHGQLWQAYDEGNADALEENDDWT